MKIVVADDNRGTLNFVTKVLEDNKFEVLKAENGIDVLNHFDDHNDIVYLLTDIRMPQKEGIRTINEVSKKFPNTKIIAMSGGDNANPERYLSLAKSKGAWDILKKPFTADELMDVIENLNE